MALLQFILCIFVPPLGVFLKVGLGRSFWINLLLSMMFVIPGIIHALFFVKDRGAVRTA